MPKLLVLSNNQVQREYALSEAPVRIGRHPSQDLQILDRLVSKEHAVIRREGVKFIIEDLSSRNGTYVNNEIISGIRLLANGDTVLIGSTHIMYVDQPTDEAGLTRVTIDPDGVQSQIQSTVNPGDSEFLKAEEIYDDEQMKRDYEKLRLAHELNCEVALEVKLDRLLPKILDVLFKFLEVDRGVILLVDPQTNDLKPAHLKTRDPSMSGQDIKISHTILNRVMRDKSAVLSSDALFDSRFTDAKSVIMQGIRSTMCIPLLGSDNTKVLGVLHLDSLLSANVFTEADLSILQGLAKQAALSIENSFLVEKLQQEAMTRQMFSRLMSPNLVEMIMEGDLEIKRGGEMREVTILFSDIRGFTSMTERIGAQEIVAMLNEYFEAMVEVVFKHQGTVDKFIGDAIMALWGAPLSVAPDEDAYHAVSAAVEMQQRIEEFNQDRVERDQEPIEIACGLDTGMIVSGYMGSENTLDYTVIGPSANLASRLCSLAKAGQVLISENTLRKVNPRVLVQEREPARVKGISHLVNNYLVSGLREPS